MNATGWYLIIGVLLLVGGLARLLLTRGSVPRLVAVNVMSAGVLSFLVILAARNEQVDPVLSALVITGLVITVAFTGVGGVLIRRIGPDERGDDS